MVFSDPLTFLFLLSWAAVMLFGIVLMGQDAYKRFPVRKIAREAPLIRLFRSIVLLGKEAEETVKCQIQAKCKLEDLIESIHELVQLRRHCLQYPLNTYWWELNSIDYKKGSVSAILTFPEMENSQLLKNQFELLWTASLSKNAKWDEPSYIVTMHWFRLRPWQSRYKHNILLSMAAYTDERIKKLNYEQELAATKSLPRAQSNYSPAAGAAMAAALPAPADSEVSWPSAQDYNEAIQNPRICFSDKELSESEVELNNLGIPKARTGAFASVYKLSGSDRQIAVRCFLNTVKDQKLRYEILSRHLEQNKCSLLAQFEYLESGIKIGKKQFPILKMDWIEGPTLNTYISDRVNDSESMLELRKQFRAMVHELRQCKIAHGDLQHGNIIVKEKQLYLVDYDGIFVPGLVRFPSSELGHPNYQHPKRAGKHFGLFLDNFAGWLIDCSLLCLSIDKDLWHKFDCGDECLLLRKSDLHRPDESKLFGYLQEHKSATLRQAVREFRDLLELELEDIPLLPGDL